VESWRRLHPGWDHVLWGDDDLGWLANRALYDAALAVVPPDAVGQLRADIARYEILDRHGGFYADADTECLAPVDDALAGHDAFAVAEDPSWVGNTYLGTVRSHQVLSDLIVGIEASIIINRGRRPNWMTGPRYLTSAWRRHGCHVDPTERWYPYSYRDVKAGTVPTTFGDDVVAVHHWGHTRDVLAARR
jgi:mannosyltransferase OCH1-like enzyme